MAVRLPCAAGMPFVDVQTGTPARVRQRGQAIAQRRVERPQRAEIARSSAGRTRLA